MKNKRFWLGILAITLVFGITVIGCDPDGGDKGPQWVKATGDDAKPFGGSLSNNGTTLTIADFPFVGKDVAIDSGGNVVDGNSESDPIIFTKSGSSGGESPDGVWYAEDNYLRMTISGNNWTLAFLDGGSYIDGAKGTLTRNGTAITLTATHIMDLGEDDSPSEGSGGGPGKPVSNTIIVQLQTGCFSMPIFGENNQIVGYGVSVEDYKETSGVIVFEFVREFGNELTSSNLSWLTVDSFSLSSGTGERTLSIDGIQKQFDGYTGAQVILFCTRSAGSDLTEDAQTATISITAGGGFTLKGDTDVYYIF